MEGLQIACIYSFGCPELKRMKEQKFISEFIKNPQREKSLLVKEILEKLEPFLFYRLIGLKNELADSFNEKIVRAYWLGTDLLEPISREDIKNFLSQRINFETRQFYLRKILDLIDGKAHHNFGTIWLIKGVKSGQRFSKNFLENVNNCLVRAGEVIELKKANLKVETKSIFFKGNKITFENSIEKIDRGFVDEIEVGNFVSIHLKSAREKISREISENLIKITEEAISFYKRAE